MVIRKAKPEKLAGLFPEFAAYLTRCRYTKCSHRVEEDCAVLDAVQKNEIAPSRHESYCALYGELEKLQKAH